MDPFDVRLEDDELLDEVELTANLIVAANQSDAHMSVTEIDEILTLRVLTYRDLEGGNTLFSHIHFGSHDHNGGIFVFLCGGGGRPSCTNLNGVFEGTIKLFVHDKEELEELVKRLKSLNGIHSVERFETEA